MGYSPLEGLVMGTRAGDLDPGILTHLLHQGMSLREIEHLLQHEAGLKALAGTADVRELQRRDDAAAELALDLFCYRIQNVWARTSPPWKARRPSCSPVASGRTLRTSGGGCANGSGGPD